MNGIIRFVKELFGVYECDYQYLVHTRDIKVDPEYRSNRIGTGKFNRKIKYWYRTGEFESPILLDKDFNLVDGYSSLVIAEINHLNKVPVYFV